MKSYWGLRGPGLIWAVLLLIVFPAYTCYGYNQGVAGNVLTLQSFVTAFPSIDTVNTIGAQEKSNSTIQGQSMLWPTGALSYSITGTVIALFTLGSAMGALLCMQYGDTLGRRMTIFCSATVATIGAVLMASSFSLAQLIVARLILGIGSGGWTATM